MTKEMVIGVLEGLVGQRFSIDSLETRLFELFSLEQHIDLVDVTSDKCDDDVSDWNLMGNLNAHGIYCDFDIYFLKLRKKDWEGNRFQVTEVGYEFSPF